VAVGECESSKAAEQPRLSPSGHKNNPNGLLNIGIIDEDIK